MRGRRTLGLGRFGLRLMLLSLLVGVMSACSHLQQPPPNLTPQGTFAWQATRVIHTLDVVRDLAITGEAQTPPMFTRHGTRLVVQWHESAITIIHQAPNGWRATVRTSLTELLSRLTPTERTQLGPYVQLAVTVLQEIP